LKLRDIAERLACRLEGNGDVDIQRVAGIEQAGPGDLTFFANPRYTAALRETRASAVILGDTAPAAACAMLRSAQPYLSFARAVALFALSSKPAAGMHATSVVAPGARIGDGAAIGPLVVIDDDVTVGRNATIYPLVTIGRGTRIGDDCVIHAHVSIRERVTIANRVIVQNGAVIGSDGYGFAKRPDGTHEKIPQAGGVVIEDDVEIGANTTIDRPAVGETRIAAGTKIDNLVQVAHGVTIGRNVLLAAQVGIAGSTRLEDDVVLAGQVGVAGHITLGAGVIATAQTGIPSSVDAGMVMSGYPAIPNRDWLKASAVFKKLPELKKTIAALEERLAALEAKLPPSRERFGPSTGSGPSRAKSRDGETGAGGDDQA